MWRPSRRLFLAGAGAALAAPALAPAARAQEAKSLRIGLVAPSSSGLTVMAASLNDHIGDAARQGALSAEATIGNDAREVGFDLVVLPANAPSPEAASRAARRLVATADLDALVGGVGEGQAGLLAEIAEEARIPFFNVGAPSDALRTARCFRYTFHIEASAAMYLDTMVRWGAEQGYRRWFVVHQDDDEGVAMRDRAAQAIGRHGAGGEFVGASAATPQLPFYGQQLNAARSADADAIMVLLSDVDQVAFVAQQESVGPLVPLVLFPHPNTQTRDYIAAIRQYAPVTNPDFRFALWDPTLSGEGAEDFNAHYLSRWGDPADPPSWAAYSALRVILEAAKATGGFDPDDVVAYLEDPATTFDLFKGPGTSFRPWDHQLRQPLILVRVDQDAVWDRNLPTTRVGVASAAGIIPDTAGSEANPRDLLDQFGDGPEADRCRSD